ncbi:LysR substrate binding domain protein [compost metagenome]
MPDELQRHVCLAITAHGRLNVWEFQDGNGRHAIRVRGSVEANSTEALRHLALAGIGIVRLSEILVGGDIRAGLLVPLLTDCNYAEAEPITVVYPHRRFLPPRVRVFVDFLAEQFARRAWEEARFHGEPADTGALPESRPML